MLLVEVATASTDVGASSARGAKIARIADLLARAAEHGEARLVAIVVSWLSGELPQRQIGVGWAALRSFPPATGVPSLTVAAVDAAFSEIGAVAGKGSQARRTELIAELFGAATPAEQTFLRRLLGGELRQGALAGVMADALAKSAAVPAADVRRAAMLAGDLPTVASAVLAGGPGALAQFTLSVGHHPGQSAQCSHRRPQACPKPSKGLVAQPFSRRSWTAFGYRSIVSVTRCRSIRAASTM